MNVMIPIFDAAGVELGVGARVAYAPSGFRSSGAMSTGTIVRLRRVPHSGYTKHPERDERIDIVRDAAGS